MAKLVIGRPNPKRRLIQTRRDLLRRAKGPRTPVRPAAAYLTSVAEKVHHVRPLEAGSFNAGLAAVPNASEYVLVYRPDEHRFNACRLDANFRVVKPSMYHFTISNCADPRIVWLPDGRLLMVYASTEGSGISYECIRGAFIADWRLAQEFSDPIPFRISPVDGARQKNWVPFTHGDDVFLVASTNPFIVYRLDVDSLECTKVCELAWNSPWPWQQFMRGNTNPICLPDGTYLHTFHTVENVNGCCFYDNGVLIFEGPPDWRILFCANRTYLRAEDASEPHFRKAGQIVCVFPVGAVREGQRVLISYGDNDSAVKVLDTTVAELMATMVAVS